MIRQIGTSISLLKDTTIGAFVQNSHPNKPYYTRTTGPRTKESSQPGINTQDKEEPTRDPRTMDNAEKVVLGLRLGVDLSFDVRNHPCM